MGAERSEAPASINKTVFIFNLTLSQSRNFKRRNVKKILRPILCIKGLFSTFSVDNFQKMFSREYVTLQRLELSTLKWTLVPEENFITPLLKSMEPKGLFRSSVFNRSYSVIHELFLFSERPNLRGKYQLHYIIFHFNW